MAPPLKIEDLLDIDFVLQALLALIGAVALVLKQVHTIVAVPGTEDFRPALPLLLFGAVKLELLELNIR